MSSSLSILLSSAAEKKIKIFKNRSWISRFSKPDYIWAYKISKHFKTNNFRVSLNFTWIVIAPFIFTQLANLDIHVMINFVHWHWQNKKYRKMPIIIVKMLNNLMFYTNVIDFQVFWTNLKCELNLRKKVYKVFSCRNYYKCNKKIS